MDPGTISAGSNSAAAVHSGYPSLQFPSSADSAAATFPSTLHYIHRHPLHLTLFLQEVSVRNNLDQLLQLLVP